MRTAVPGTILLLLSTTAVIAASGARIESGVVLMPNETLVAPAGPVAAPRPAPKPAPRPTPRYSREEVRSDTYAPSSRSVCINCGVVTSIDEGDTSFYLSAVDLVRGDEPGFNRWRRGLFLATSRLTSDAAEYFHLPREKTVIVGSRIEV